MVAGLAAAEEAASSEEMNKLLDLAQSGIRTLIEKQKEALELKGE